MSYSGELLKMATALDGAGLAGYTLLVGEVRLPLVPGAQRLRMEFSGEIHCIACDRKTKKSYSQGYCFPCSQSLARCDLCIVRPETCHYHLGNCREPAWGEANCLQPHIVYLSNTSGVKVGITRGTQIPTRWIDQGATQALPIFQVATRLLAGQVESILKTHIADRTDWRKMLKGDAEPLDLVAQRDRLLTVAQQELDALRTTDAAGMMLPLPTAESVTIRYPVKNYPEKVTALNLDKQPLIVGELLGIKGQYLILDSGVLNIRKYAGYRVTVTL